MADFSWNQGLAAGGIGITHTLLGPDHHLPFVMLAKARSWSWNRALAVTALRDVGHVLGPILCGAVGLAIGVLIPLFLVPATVDAGTS